MALIIGDNFSYQGAKPLDARLKYDTIAAMAAMADSILYDGCLAYCSATDKTYQWKSTNTIDSTLGRWREFEFDSIVELTQAEYDALPDTKNSDDKTYFIVDGQGGGGGGASTLAELTDVNITTPAEGEVLKYDEQNEEWKNVDEALSEADIALIKQNFQVDPYGSIPLPLTETDVLDIKDAFVIA